MQLEMMPSGSLLLGNIELKVVTVNTMRRLQEGQRQWLQRLREEVIISAGLRQDFLGKLVFKLSFEEWAGFEYLVMGNGTPSRIHCASKTKER